MSKTVSVRALRDFPVPEGQSRRLIIANEVTSVPADWVKSQKENKLDKGKFEVVPESRVPSDEPTPLPAEGEPAAPRRRATKAKGRSKRS
jgi:hypothetical protein